MMGPRLSPRPAPPAYRVRSSVDVNGLEMVIFSNENSAGPASLTAHPDSDRAVATTRILRCRDVMVESCPHAVDGGVAASPEFRIGRPSGPRLLRSALTATPRPAIPPQLA